MSGASGVDELRVETADGRTVFAPGDVVEGTASWRLGEPPRRLEVRLFWYTQGKGDQDVGVADSMLVAVPAAEGRRDFRLRLPAGPYSLSGKLISLLWAVELVAEPGERAARVEIVVSPTGREVLLQPSGAGSRGAGPR